MHRIELTGGPPAGSPPVKISLGFAFNELAGDPTSVGNNWGGLDARGLNNSWFYGGIGGNLTGDINVDQLFRFDAGLYIQASVTAGGSGNGSYFIVESSQITNTGSVILETGNIDRVRGGAINGVVRADAGNIVLVDTVAIGATGFVNAPGAGASIGTITVSGNVDGRIYAEQGSL